MPKNSSRTDGLKFQVKLSMRASAWILKYAEDRGLPAADVVRDFVEEGLYLFGVPHDDFARLVTAAKRERLPLPEFIKNVLSRAAHALPPGAKDVEIPTRFPDVPQPGKHRQK